MNNSITFIGFGEAAYNISKGLRQEGLTDMCAYDIAVNDEKRGELIRKRAAEAGVKLMENEEEAVKSSRFVAALTSASAAADTAKAALRFMTEEQIYVDMNSCAPTTLSEIENLTEKGNVKICDIAIMSSVPTSGHKVKMYLSGEGAKVFYDYFTPYHMNLNLLDAPAGGASAIKMFKSVFSKGLPQLLLEAMVPAQEYGVLDELANSLKNTFKEKNVEEYAEAYLCKTLIHAKRRYAEVNDVVRTIESMGMDASMSRATAERLKKLAEFGYADRLGAASEFGYREAVELVLDDYKKKEEN